MKIIKKVSTFIFTAILIFSIALVTYANTNIQELNNSDSNNNAKNTANYKKSLQDERKIKENEICNILDEKIKQGMSENIIGDNIKDLSISNYDYDNAYKVNIISPMMLTKYNNENSFENIITDKSQWIVPVYNKNGERGFATLIGDNSDLKLVGISYGGNQAQMPTDIDAVFNKIESVSGEGIGIKSIKYTYSLYYYITFIYFNTTDEEYVIPFTNIADQININNGEVYTVKNMFSILNKSFDESIINKTGENNGGLPFRQPKFPFEILIVISISLISMIFCIKYLFSKKSINNIRLSKKH